MNKSNVNDKKKAVAKKMSQKGKGSLESTQKHKIDYMGQRSYKEENT